MAENKSIFHGLVQQRATDPPTATENTTESNTKTSSQHRAVPKEETSETSENITQKGAFQSSSQLRLKDQFSDGDSNEAIDLERTASNDVGQKGAFHSASGPRYKDQFQNVSPEERIVPKGIASNEVVQKGAFHSASGPEFKDQFRNVSPGERMVSQKGAFSSKSGPHYKDQLRDAGSRDRTAKGTRSTGMAGPHYKDQLREANEVRDNNQRPINFLIITTGSGRQEPNSRTFSPI